MCIILCIKYSIQSNGCVQELERGDPWHHYFSACEVAKIIVATRLCV